MRIAISAAMQREKVIQEEDPGSRTELDSHANMAVVRRNAHVLAESGKDVVVGAFTPELKSLSYKVVDAAIQYDDPYEQKSYVFIIRNALHVPAMSINLLPPFMIREAGIKINDVPKIHVDQPTKDDHAIILEKQVLESQCHYGEYFPTSQAPNLVLSSSRNQRIFIYSHPVFGTHILMFMHTMKSPCWTGKAT